MLNSVFLLVPRLAGELAESFISGSLGSRHSFLARLDLHLPLNCVIQQVGAVQESHLRGVGAQVQQLDGLVDAADADVVHHLEHAVDRLGVVGILGGLLQGALQGVRHEPQLTNEGSVDSVQARQVLVLLVLVVAVGTRGLSPHVVVVVVEVEAPHVVAVVFLPRVTVATAALSLCPPLSSHGREAKEAHLLGRDERDQTKNNEELHSGSADVLVGFSIFT